MVVDPGVRHRRRRNRLACRARRATVRARRLRGTSHVEEVAFAGVRAEAIGGTAGTGTAKGLMHPKTRRNRQVPDILCDSFVSNGALRRTLGFGRAKPGKPG